VNPGGKLIMETGAAITDNHNDTGLSSLLLYGGGFNIETQAGLKGTLILKGGTIRGNSAVFGGGVHAYGNFTMEGGEITGNTAVSSGGGVCVNEGVFTMTGGTISGNYSVGDATEVLDAAFPPPPNPIYRVGGGGVYVLGAFTMKGGTISGNISDAYGGGVLILGKWWSGDIYSTFTKTGGIIYGKDGSPNQNTAAATDPITGATGHAVYAAAYAIDSSGAQLKQRNNTSGPTGNLTYTVNILGIHAAPTAWD
jgi:hypothetical protein